MDLENLCVQACLGYWDAAYQPITDSPFLVNKLIHLVHSFEHSVMKRTNTETLAEIEEIIQVDINLGHEIFGREDEATVVLLSSFFRSVEALLHQYDSFTQSLH